MPTATHTRRRQSSFRPRDLRGDLDWIVVECLEKDRGRRYATASDLVSDIERHLDAQPVLARPPSTLYRAKKLVRRHGAAIAAGSLLFATMLLGIIVSMNQAIRAKRAEKLAEEGQTVQAQLREKAERGEAQAKASAEAAALNEYVADINLTQLALSEGNFGRAQQLIDKHRPAAGETDHRSFEWYYLADQCRGDPHVALPNQGGTVRCLAYSRDGTTLAVGLSDEIRLWNVRTRTRITSLPGGATSLLFLNDGRTLVSADGNSTWIVDTQTWLEVAELPGQRGPLALSRDGTQLATSGRDGVYLWDTRDWFELQRLPQVPPGPLAFSRDGRILATPGRDGITLWSLGDRAVVRVLDDSAGIFGDGEGALLVFSADGNHIVAPRNTNSARGVFVLSLWDVHTGEEIGVLPNTPGHSGAITDLGLSRRRNLLVTASLDHSVAVWDLTAQESVAQLSGHRGEVWCVAISPDGRTVASGSKDGDLRIWPTTPPEQGDTITGVLVPLAFSQDGRRLAAVDDGPQLTVFGLPDLNAERTLEVGSFAAVDGELDTLVHGRGGVAEMIDMESLQKRSLEAPAAALDFLGLSPDGSVLLTRGRLQAMHWWDLSTQPEQRVRSLRADSAVFSADSAVLAAFGLGDRVEIWDVAEHELRRGFTAPRTFGFGAALSPDGSLLALTGGLSDSENLVSLWDTATGERVGELSGHKQSVRSVAFTPDGRTLATASSDGSLKLWNIATRQELLSIRRLGTSLRHLKFSPDGQWLVGASAPNTPEPELRFLHAPRGS